MKVINKTILSILLFFFFIVIFVNQKRFFSQTIIEPDYCEGNIQCLSQGDCKMSGIGVCISYSCDKSHCPYSNKKCVYRDNYSGKCKELTSIEKLCQDYCYSIPLISCYCTSKEGSGACFDVKDCRNS